MPEKNIFATTIKQIRKSLGMSLREFSDEIGIALSSLTEYESGNRLPRWGTVVQIAEKLHRSPSSLVSGVSSDDMALHSCLEVLSLYVQTMHPDTRASAEHALKLFRLALKTSENLFSMESQAAPPEDSSARFRYELHETLTSSPRYGILVRELREGNWFSTAVFAPFSDDRLTVQNIVLSANKLQLPPDEFFSLSFHEFLLLP